MIRSFILCSEPSCRRPAGSADRSGVKLIEFMAHREGDRTGTAAPLKGTGIFIDLLGCLKRGPRIGSCRYSLPSRVECGLRDETSRQVSSGLHPLGKAAQDRGRVETGTPEAQRLQLTSTNESLGE